MIILGGDPSDLVVDRDTGFFPQLPENTNLSACSECYCLHVSLLAQAVAFVYERYYYHYV